MKINFRKIGNFALKAGKVIAQVAHALNALKPTKGPLSKK